MANGKSLTPKSFRIDDQTAEKIKEIANTTGSNQQETMQLLLNAYFLQEQKTGLVEHKASIEQFEAYTTSIITMYTQSLQANHDLRETVLHEFDATLKSKEFVIQDLQRQLTAAKQAKEDAEAKAKEYADQNKALVKENEGLQSVLADKESLNKALSDSCTGLKAKIERLEDAAGQAETLRQQLDQLQKGHEEALRQQADLQKQLQQEREAHTDAMEHLKEQLNLEHDKAILEIEKAHQGALQKVKSKAQAEIDTYQKKYFDLLQQLQGKDAIRQK